MKTKNDQAIIESLIKALKAAESTFKRINVKNEQAAELALAAMKDVGIGDKWPGGVFEDIAEAAQGRASLCRQAIADAIAEREAA